MTNRPLREILQNRLSSEPSFVQICPDSGAVQLEYEYVKMRISGDPSSLGLLMTGGQQNMRTLEWERLEQLIDSLNTQGCREFLLDLLQAIKEASETNNIASVLDVLEDWAETAEILEDENLMDYIMEAQKEFAQGGGRVWTPKFDTL